MSQDVTLVRATDADLEALALVAGASFLEAFAGVLDGADIVAHVARNSSAAAFAGYIAQGATATLAFAPGGAPVGYTLLTDPDLPGTLAGDRELKRIYTLAPFWGTGLGAALLKRAVEDARGQGALRLTLGVYGRNARAHRFYEKHGFVRAGARRFLVGATWHDDRVYALAL